MKECQDCEYKGYSRQFCMVHVAHCKNREEQEKKPLSKPVRVGVKTLAGVGVGMGAVVLGSTAVSLVGGAVLVHALLLKLGAGAGLAGGGIGFFKGLTENKNETDPE